MLDTGFQADLFCVFLARPSPYSRLDPRRSRADVRASYVCSLAHGRCRFLRDQRKVSETYIESGQPADRRQPLALVEAIPEGDSELHDANGAICDAESRE